MGELSREPYDEEVSLQHAGGRRVRLSLFQSNQASHGMAKSASGLRYDFQLGNQL